MNYRMRYDREDDVLMVWFAQGIEIDHAEHSGDLILHMARVDPNKSE